MPAKLRLYGRRYFAGVQCQHGLFEGRNHHAKTEPAKIPTGWTGWAGGFFDGCFGEISTIVDHRFDLDRFVFGFNQDVGGVEFSVRHDIRKTRIIGQLQICFINWCAGERVDHFARPQGAHFVRDGDADPFWFNLERIAKELLVHQLIDQSVENNVIGQLLILFWQL